METRENMQDNYRQPKEGDDQQTIIIDPAFLQQGPPIDPEDEESDQDTEDDEQFPLHIQFYFLTKNDYDHGKQKKKN